MTYYMYIESGCAFEAESEEDAREQAIAWYIEQLQKGEIELLIESDDSECRNSGDGGRCVNKK